MAKKDTIKKLLADLKKTNSEMKQYIESLDKKILKIDKQYYQGLLRKDVNILRTARQLSKKG